MCLIFVCVCFVVCILTSTICTRESMNINVWIITKICKALNQSFWVIFVVSSWLPTAIHVTLALPRKTRRRARAPSASSSYVHTSSRKFLKVLIQSRGASPSRGSSIISSSRACSGFAPFLQKTKEKPPSAQRHSRLATNLHPLSAISECRRHRGPGGRGAWRAGRLHRRLEVMSKQVIIMRWALQKLTRLSRRSVTHSSASRYSRESSSHTCSRSTAKRQKRMGT